MKLIIHLIASHLISKQSIACLLHTEHTGDCACVAFSFYQNHFCSLLGSLTPRPNEKKCNFRIILKHLHREACERARAHTREAYWRILVSFRYWNQLLEWSLAICNKQLIFYNQFFWLRDQFFFFFFSSFYLFSFNFRFLYNYYYCYYCMTCVLAAGCWLPRKTQEYETSEREHKALSTHECLNVSCTHRMTKM